MIAIEEDVQKLIDSTDIMAKETFEDSKKMREFLKTLSNMYNTSYSNILLLKSQRDDINFITSKEEFEKYKCHVKDGEKPLKIIKRIKTEEGVKFKVAEVFDISQTDAVRNKKVYEKEYIDKMLKGMCERRGLYYDPNNQMLNIESIVGDISQNTRQRNNLKYDVDKYASQSQAEVNATIFVVAKKLGINTRNYNLKDVCKWGIDKDTKTLKESLKYMQKFTNYFVKDFESQEKINKIEKQEQEEME